METKSEPHGAKGMNCMAKLVIPTVPGQESQRLAPCAQRESYKSGRIAPGHISQKIRRKARERFSGTRVLYTRAKGTVPAALARWQSHSTLGNTGRLNSGVRVGGAECVEDGTRGFLCRTVPPTGKDRLRCWVPFSPKDIQRSACLSDDRRYELVPGWCPGQGQRNAHRGSSPWAMIQIQIQSPADPGNNIVRVRRFIAGFQRPAPTEK
ncbi:hypothetical protein FB451DRAFT_1163870 [Mycena latifolia]|nr:hypothetical protein FB451DRAFT_1163870 [Mycena latifolia]